MNYVLVIFVVINLILLQKEVRMLHAKKNKKKQKKTKKRPGLGMVGLCSKNICQFTMGGDEKSGSPGTRYVELQSYKIDRTSVTNQMFRKYIKETKYKTESEHLAGVLYLTRSCRIKLEKITHRRWKKEVSIGEQ